MSPRAEDRRGARACSRRVSKRLRLMFRQNNVICYIHRSNYLLKKRGFALICYLYINCFDPIVHLVMLGVVGIVDERVRCTQHFIWIVDFLNNFPHVYGACRQCFFARTNVKISGKRVENVNPRYINVVQ